MFLSIADILEKPFTDFLKSRKLTATVQHYIQHSIAMATDSMTTKQVNIVKYSVEQNNGNLTTFWFDNLFVLYHFPFFF